MPSLLWSQGSGCALQGLVALIVTAWGAAPAGAQSVAMPLPVAQVVDGNTITIDKAGFYREGDFAHTWLGGSSEPQRKAFMIAYSVQLPGLKPEQKALSMPNESKVRLFSPQGELLYQSITARSNTGGVEKWDDVAPYWDHVTADFEWPDPAAPTGADGRFTTKLEFKGVPMPTAFDTPVQVNRLLATANGTELYLEKVTSHKVEGGGTGGALDITVSWEPAPDLPDTSVELAVEAMQDSHGAALQPNGSTSYRDRIYTFPNEPVPAANNKTFDFTLGINETIPSLQQPPWFKHFRFDLKLPVALPPAPGVAPETLKTVAGDDVIGELESNATITYNFRGRLWLRARPGDVPDPLMVWIVKSIIGHDEAGHEFKSGWDYEAQERLFRKPDERAAAVGERSQVFQLTFQNNQKPAHLSVTAEVEPAHHRHQVFEFAAVPVPAPGQTKALEQTVQANEPVPAPPGGAITLRQITAFKSPGVLIGLNAEQRAKLPLSAGLALCFVAPPTLGAQARQELALGLVADTQGRTVQGYRPFDMVPGDVLAPGAPAPHTWTVLLMQPSLKATNLRVQVITDELLSVGPSRTLEFQDVALPAPPGTFF